MITASDQIDDAPPVSRPDRRYTLLTLIIVAMVAFIVGGALFGAIAKLIWQEHANGWKEIAMGYKAVSSSCVSVDPNTIQPMKKSDKSDPDATTIAAKP